MSEAPEASVGLPERRLEDLLGYLDVPTTPTSDESVSQFLAAYRSDGFDAFVLAEPVPDGQQPAPAPEAKQRSHDSATSVAPRPR